LNREVESFWETPPSVGGRARSLRANPLEHRPTVESLNYEAFDVDHSIYGATAYGLETSMGWIAYTGDLRFHGKHGKMTEKFVDFFCRKDCFLLIVEGTNIGDRTRNTEENVFQNCCRETESARGKLVIADFGPRNIERLETFLRIAKETKRQLVICPRDVYILNAMRTVDKKIPLPEREPNVLIYKERKASYKFWEKKIHENYDSRLVTMDEIKNSQGAYILCFSFFDINELTDIKPVEGSIYIYSACEAITEEQEFDFVRLANWLTSLQIAPIGFRIIDVKTENGEILKRPQFDRRYHSSGHLSEHDIIKIVDEIQPKFLLPVHTEKTEFFKNKFGDIFVEVEEGKPIKIK
jgi:ribonuclease J